MAKSRIDRARIFSFAKEPTRDRSSGPVNRQGRVKSSHEGHVDSPGASSGFGSLRCLGTARRRCGQRRRIVSRVRTRRGVQGMRELFVRRAVLRPARAHRRLHARLCLPVLLCPRPLQKQPRHLCATRAVRQTQGLNGKKDLVL